MPVLLVPADVPFLPALSGWLTQTFEGTDSRRALSLWLPTARAGHSLCTHLAAHGWDMLPAINTLALDETSAVALGVHDDGPPVADPSSQLAAVTAFWQRHKPSLSARQAVQLAGDFLGLYGRLVRAGKTLADVASVVPDALAAHWQSYAADLQSIGTAYEGWLHENGVRHNATAATAWLQKLARTYAQDLAAPVVMAGLTDLTPAAKQVAQALAAQSNGWVILPHTARGHALADELGGGTLLTPLPAQATPSRAVVEAPTPLQEGRAIALAVRQAFAEGRTPVAVVAVNRDTARLVEDTLAAAGMVAADSAGTPLTETAAGRLLLAMAQATATPTATAMAALCAHPLVAACANWHTAAPALEACLWRGISDTATWPAWRRKWRGLRWHPDRRFRTWAEVATPAWEALDAVWTEAPARQSPAAWAAIWQARLKMLAPLFDGASGSAEVTACVACLPDTPAVDATTAQALLENLLAQGKLPTVAPTRHLYLWGEQEARLQTVGTLIVAGCNEESWPPVVHDPWLNQGQLQRLELADNQHREAVAKEDWQLMQAHATHLVYTRSLQSGGTATVPSRYWLWMKNDPAFKSWNDVGDSLLAWDDMRARAAMPVMPAAFPPDNARPVAWSASMVETLRQCPYRALAERVMEIAPLPPFDDEPDPRALGLLIHRWLENLFGEVKGLPAPLAPAVHGDAAAVEAHLLESGRILMDDQPAPLARMWSVRLPLLAKAIARQIAVDHAAGWRVLHHEWKAEVAMDDGPTVFAKMDRVDSRNGVLRVIDYKTGTPPAGSKLASGEKPQLPLEGWLLRSMGETVESASFWHTKGYGNTPLDVQTSAGEKWAAHVQAVPAGLQEMSATLANKPWPAWPDMDGGGLTATGHCEHCHLANVCRFREWSA